MQAGAKGFMLLLHSFQGQQKPLQDRVMARWKIKNVCVSQWARPQMLSFSSKTLTADEQEIKENPA